MCSAHPPAPSPPPPPPAAAAAAAGRAALARARAAARRSRSFCRFACCSIARLNSDEVMQPHARMAMPARADTCEDGGRHGGVSWSLHADARLEAFGRLHGCMLGAQPAWTDDSDVDPAQVPARLPESLPESLPCPKPQGRRPRSITIRYRAPHERMGGEKGGGRTTGKQAKGNLRGRTT